MAMRAPPIVHSVLTCALPPRPVPRSVVFCAPAAAASTVLSTPAAITRVVTLIELPGWQGWSRQRGALAGAASPTWRPVFSLRSARTNPDGDVRVRVLLCLDEVSSPPSGESNGRDAFRPLECLCRRGAAVRDRLRRTCPGSARSQATRDQRFRQDGRRADARRCQGLS